MLQLPPEIRNSFGFCCKKELISMTLVAAREVLCTQRQITVLWILLKCWFLLSLMLT